MGPGGLELKLPKLSRITNKVITTNNYLSRYVCSICNEFTPVFWGFAPQTERSDGCSCPGFLMISIVFLEERSLKDPPFSVVTSGGLGSRSTVASAITWSSNKSFHPSEATSVSCRKYRIK